MAYDINRRVERLDEMSSDFKNMMTAIAFFKEKYKVEDMSLVVHPSAAPFIRTATAAYHTPKLTDANGVIYFMNVSIRFGTFKTATVLGE